MLAYCLRKLYSDFIPIGSSCCKCLKALSNFVIQTIKLCSFLVFFTTDKADKIKEIKKKEEKYQAEQVMFYQLAWLLHVVDADVTAGDITKCFVGSLGEFHDGEA